MTAKVKAIARPVLNPVVRRTRSDRDEPRSGDQLHAVPLKVVARELGCTTERVRQIEVKALAKLRAALEAKGYTAADLIPGVGD